MRLLYSYAVPAPGSLRGRLSLTIRLALAGSAEWVKKWRLAGEPIALDLPLYGSGSHGVVEQCKPVAE